MIQHLSRVTVPAGALELDLTDVRVTDRHEVLPPASASWHISGTEVAVCDSCGRVILRGMGRWWERGGVR